MKGQLNLQPNKKTLWNEEDNIKMDMLHANGIPTRPKSTQYNAAYIEKGIEAKTAPNFPAISLQKVICLWKIFPPNWKIVLVQNINRNEKLKLLYTRPKLRVASRQSRTSKKYKGVFDSKYGIRVENV